MKESQRQLKKMYANLERYARDISCIDPEHAYRGSSRKSRVKQKAAKMTREMLQDGPKGY